MKTEILLKSKSCSLKAFRRQCFLLPFLLLAAGVLYSLFLYLGNVNDCRTYADTGYCLLVYKQHNGYPAFLALALLYGKFTRLLPLLLYSGLLLLLRGLWLYRARGRGEMVVTDREIRGRTTWGDPVFLPLSAVRQVSTGPWESVVLKIDGGELPFYHIENRQEICKVLEDCLKTERKAPAPGEISISGKTGDPRLLALRCFLPAGALLLAFLCLGAGKALWYRQAYFASQSLMEEELLFFKLLGNLISGNLGRLTRACFYLFFPALAAGSYVFMAGRASSLNLSQGSIRGNSRFGGRLELPLEDCCAVSRGRRGTLIFYYPGGRAVFEGIQNREEICSALLENWRCRKNEK